MKIILTYRQRLLSIFFLMAMVPTIDILGGKDRSYNSIVMLNICYIIMMFASVKTWNLYFSCMISLLSDGWHGKLNLTK